MDCRSIEVLGFKGATHPSLSCNSVSFSSLMYLRPVVPILQNNNDKKKQSQIFIPYRRTVELQNCRTVEPYTFKALEL